MAGERDLRYAASTPEAAAPASPTASDELLPTEAIERDRAAMVLLRQLASGLSSYRLFPGDLEQPSFVAATERIRDAAEKALVWGAVDLEINGSRFLGPSGPLTPDERMERLALALYHHGAERLQLREPPDARSLGVLFEALAQPARPGGVGAALEVAGVRSISVQEVAPQGATGGPEAGQGPAREQRELWERMGEPDTLAAEMVQAAGSYLPAEAAQAIFGRLRYIVSTLPEPVVKGVQLYGRLHEVIAHLPPALRRELMAILLGHITSDPLAERLIGTMTDAELARVLVDQGEDGRSDPMDLARRLVTLGVRRDDVEDLTAALMLGQVEGTTIMTGADRVVEDVSDEDSPVATTVSSLLARGLVSGKQEDVRAIREAFPETADDRTQVAVDALYDYLRIENEPDRLGEVLAVWSSEATATLRRHDEGHLAQLLEAIDGAREEGLPTEKRAAAEASIRRALSPEVLTDLVATTRDDEDPDSSVRMLDLFGDIGVDCLMEDLAQERDRGRRALLLSVLAHVARGRSERVTMWLSDPRWFVARNAVTVLYRSGREDTVPLLLHASRHREPAVRREAARGMVELLGTGALSHLTALAGDRDPAVRAGVLAALGTMLSPEACRALGDLARTMKDPADRRRAIQVLGRHARPEATEALETLASSKGSGRLPWRLRREAKELAKSRREGGR